MRILFATEAVDRISTQLNAPNYARLNDIEGIRIDFYNQNYADYDVVLFMGYDPRVAEARAAKPSLKIGVIDIRPATLNISLGADFAIANGVEMHDWLSNYFENIYLYPIYPQIHTPLKQHSQTSPLIVGYHGNKVHLTTIRSCIGAALEALAEHHKIELWAVYDIKTLGEIPFELCDPRKVRVCYIQWSPDVYEKQLAHADIGIVPGVVPIEAEDAAKEKIKSHSSAFQPHVSDYLVRYKISSNAGRIFVFSQLGIPVITGITPSASQVIQHGFNGYLAHSKGGWYSALKKLADSAEHRKQLGDKLYETFQTGFSIDVLNRKLINFIRDLKAKEVS